MRGLVAAALLVVALPSQATTMNVYFAASGNYSCANATNVTFTATPNPTWRWTCGSTVKMCREDSISTDYVPGLQMIYLDCTEIVAPPPPNGIFQDSFE
jgi:hypothetical protein